MQNINKIKKNIKNILDEYELNCLSIHSSNTKPENEKFELSLENSEAIKNNNFNLLTYNDLQKKIDFINYIRISYNQMTVNEKKLIYWTYLDKEHNYDDRYIANNLGWSLGYYYTKKKETLIRFAYSLGLEKEGVKFYVQDKSNAK